MFFYAIQTANLLVFGYVAVFDSEDWLHRLLPTLIVALTSCNLGLFAQDDLNRRRRT